LEEGDRECGDGMNRSRRVGWWRGVWRGWLKGSIVQVQKTFDDDPEKDAFSSHVDQDLAWESMVVQVHAQGQGGEICASETDLVNEDH
jgi:hypothetical protein